MHGENCIIHDLVFKTLKSDFIGLPDRKSPIQAKINLKVLPAANIYFHPFCVLFFLSLWAFELVFSSWGCWYFGFDFFFFTFITLARLEISQNLVFMDFSLFSGGHFKYLSALLKLD